MIKKQCQDEQEFQSISGTPSFMQNSGTFSLIVILRPMWPLPPTPPSAIFFSTNDGVSTDTLVEPMISHQQPELWATLHLPFLLLLSSCIAKKS
jgi:hypothetical protein